MWTCGAKWKTAAFPMAVSVLTLTVFTLYLYGEPSVPSGRNVKGKEQTDSAHSKTLPSEAIEEKKAVSKTFQFDMMGSDVMVFLHMQKTGGTHFGKKLVKSLDIDNKCVCQEAECCQCKCYRPKSRRVWLFSRYSVGWPCGVHADITELKDCVPEYFSKLEGRRRQTRMRYLYVTNIREPVSRFLSEFRNVQRGATWINAHKCNGRIPTDHELPSCYSGSNWRDVALDAFMNCPWNLAINRQTRMLANLSLVNCYNNSGMSQVTRDRIMLQSAKKNLKQMAYFGLVEYQRDSQYLFEQIIGIKIVTSPQQKKATYAEDTLLGLEEKTVDRITRLNHLDVELYQFARGLFVKRLKYFREREDRFIE